MLTKLEINIQVKPYYENEPIKYIMARAMRDQVLSLLTDYLYLNIADRMGLSMAERIASTYWHGWLWEMHEEIRSKC